VWNWQFSKEKKGALANNGGNSLQPSLGKWLIFLIISVLDLATYLGNG
jgi:hypothetical protein